MPIFRLEGDDNSNAELVVAEETKLERESYLENWLENSPRGLIPSEKILWIGRQTSTSDDGGTMYSDLLGVDIDGNLIIVELKKGRTSRDVVAQLLDYAAWADRLSDEKIQQIAQEYFETRPEVKEKTFHDAFKNMFEIPESGKLLSLNQKLRLFVVAEEIPTRVEQVCKFLRDSYGMEINCIAVSMFQTGAGERLISMETKVGNENAIASKTQRQSNSQTPRWTGDKPVKQVVWEAVQEFVGENADKEFAIKDLKPIIEKKYPEFKMSNVSPEIRADCVNNPKRHEHYSGNKNRYWQTPTGKYRLYDPEKDKIEDSDDSIQN